MTDQIYPELGTKARYMRATPEGEIIEGVGIVKAIFLDPRKRLMVQVVDIDTAASWNVDFIGINYADDMHEKYARVIEGVTDITLEGNKLVQETVKGYNEQVEELYTSVLGAPIDFVEPEAPEADKPTEH